MTKFIKTLLSIAGGCLVLGIILSIVGLCRADGLPVSASAGTTAPVSITPTLLPTVNSALFRADASGAPLRPWCALPSSSGSVPTGSVRELEIDISTAEVVIQPGDAYDLRVSGSPRYGVQGLRRGVDD